MACGMALRSRTTWSGGRRTTSGSARCWTGSRRTATSAIAHPHIIRTDLADLNHRWFYRPDFARIWLFIRDALAEGHAVRPDNLGQLMRARSMPGEVISTAYECVQSWGPGNAHPGTDLLRSFLTEVRDHFVRREIIRRSQELQHSVSQHRTVEDLKAQAAGTMQQILTLGLAGGEANPIGKFTEQVLVEAQEAQEALVDGDQRKQSRLTTGYLFLVQSFGGVRRGHLVTIGARPGMGKTGLMLELALAAAIDAKKSRGDGPTEHVLIDSLEQPAAELTTRLLARWTGLTHTDIANGNLSQTKWDILQSAQPEVDDLPIKIWHRPRSSMEHVLASIYIEAAKHPLRMVCVDYLQIVRVAVDRGGRLDLALSDAVADFKGACADVGAVGILLSQLSRSGVARTNGTPTLESLKETGGLEEVSDVVLGLDRPGHRGTEGFGMADMLIHILKCRSASLGTLRAKFIGAQMKVDIWGFYEPVMPVQDTPARPGGFG